MPAQARRLGLADVRVAAHRGVQHRGDEEADDVDQEAPADADEATSRPPIAGPTSTPACMPKLLSALAAVDLVVPDGARQQRLARGSLQRRGRRQQPGDARRSPTAAGRPRTR